VIVRKHCVLRATELSGWFVLMVGVYEMIHCRGLWHIQEFLGSFQLPLDYTL